MGMLVKIISVFAKYPLSIADNLTASKRSQIVITKDLEKLSADKPILIYVHYSKNGLVSEREIHSLQNVRKAGLQVCLVINSSDGEIKLSNQGFFDAQIIRKNRGWDLGAYRDAFKQLKKHSKVTGAPVFFMNNSVIWFPDMIENYFQSALSQKSDIIAGSISSEYRIHIQTFLFGGLTQSGVENLGSWLGLIKNWRMKRTVVRLGELGTNQLFQKQLQIKGLPDQSVLTESGLRKIHSNYTNLTNSIPYEVFQRLLRNRDYTMAGLPLNPSHNCWLELLEEGFPGIKVDLIKSNPSNLFDYEHAISKLLENSFSFSELDNLLKSNKSRSLIFKIRTAIKW
jgi:hypothetical protein